VIPQWSGAPALFAPEPETEYSLWGGDIGGRVLDVAPMERLVQTWKPQNWSTENSVVTFLLTPTDGGTRVDLVHENVEESDYEGTNEGWDIYYLGAIKKMLEAPAPRKRAAKKAAPKKKAATKKMATAKKKHASKMKRLSKKTTPQKSAAKKKR
jgi:hypothetical protein